jgi:hypothetical protein
MIRTLILAAGTLAFLAVATPAKAGTQEPFTAEACIKHLTEDLDGPRLDPLHLVPRSDIEIDGKSYTIYPGIVLDDLCKQAVARRQELSVRDARIKTLSSELAGMKANEQSAGRRLDALLKDPRVKYARWISAGAMILLAWIGATYAIIFGWKWFVRVWRAISRPRRRYGAFAPR